MNAKQFAALEQAMQTWIDQHCGDIDWPDVIVHPTMADHMAQAAGAVFDASDAAQLYAKHGRSHGDE